MGDKNKDTPQFSTGIVKEPSRFLSGNTREKQGQFTFQQILHMYIQHPKASKGMYDVNKTLRRRTV